MSRAFLDSDIQKVWLLLIIAKCAAAATLPCTQLQGAKPKQELAYLQRDRSRLDPACIVYAIEQLGLHYHTVPYRPSAGAEAAAGVLVMYLDFQAPGTENIGKRMIQAKDRIPWLGDKYPAATALFQIGIQSTPSLVRAIGSAAYSELLRKNAIETLFAVHRENVSEGARALNIASRSASDNGVSIRLLDAAREFAAKCPGQWRNGCEAALLER